MHINIETQRVKRFSTDYFKTSARSAASQLTIEELPGKMP